MSKTTKKKEINTAYNYRVLAQSVRTWQIFSMVLVVMCIMCLSAIVAMMPLKETEVRYIEFTSSNDNFFTVHPANMDKNTKQLLIRKQLRNYVYNREKRDGATEVHRFKAVRSMSSNETFNGFKESYYDARKKFEDINRDIEIVSDTPISKGVHQIEFQTLDTKDGLMRRASFFATVTYQITPQIVNEDIALQNPMGVNVTGYVLSKRGDQG